MFDVDAARKAGRTDAEIAAYLASQLDYDLDAARKAGYSDQDLVRHLSNAMPMREPEGMLERGAMALSGGMDALQQVPYVGPVFRGIRNTAQGAAQLAARAGESMGIIDPQTVREYEQIAGRSRDQFKQQHPNGSWGEFAGEMVLPAGPVGKGVVGALGAGAMGGALYGATRPEDNPDYWQSKLKDTAIGAGAGAAGSALMHGATGLIGPRLAPEARRLADEGVTLTPGQTVGGIAKRMEESANSTPFIGGVFRGAQERTLADFNRAAANRALAPIGESLPKGMAPGRGMVDYVQRTLGQRYDDLVPQMSGRVDDVLERDLMRIADDLGNLFPAERQKFLNILAKRTEGRVNNRTQTIKGDALHTILKELQEESSKIKGATETPLRALSRALDEAEGPILAMVERTPGNNAALVKALKDTNKGYANFKRVQRAAGSTGAEDGVFSAEQLRMAVRALDRSKDKGDFAKGSALMQDLADDGISVLGRKVPDSGTPERAGVIGALLGGAAYVEPVSALVAALSAAPYTTLGQKSFSALATKRPAQFYALSNALRNMTPIAGAAGAYQITE